MIHSSDEATPRLHQCIHCTCLSILCWLKTEQGCGTFKGGERDSKVGQSKNIFNNYSWYPAYLYHTSTLRKKKSASRCSVGRQSGDNKIRQSGRRFRRESPGIKSENRVKSRNIVYLFSLGLRWSVGAMHRVHSAMCAVQTLPLMLDAKFFQRLLCRRQQASHQTPTLYPPVQNDCQDWLN